MPRSQAAGGAGAAAGPGAPEDTDGSLALTGVDAAGLLAGGLALVAGGAAAIVVGRRRRGPARTPTA